MCPPSRFVVASTGRSGCLDRGSRELGDAVAAAGRDPGIATSINIAHSLHGRVAVALVGAPRPPGYVQARWSRLHEALRRHAAADQEFAHAIGEFDRALHELEGAHMAARPGVSTGAVPAAASPAADRAVSSPTSSSGADPSASPAAQPPPPPPPVSSPAGVAAVATVGATPAAAAADAASPAAGGAGASAASVAAGACPPSANAADGKGPAPARWPRSTCATCGEEKASHQFEMLHGVSRCRDCAQVALAAWRVAAAAQATQAPALAPGAAPARRRWPTPPPPPCRAGVAPALACQQAAAAAAAPAAAVHPPVAAAGAAAAAAGAAAPGPWVNAAAAPDAPPMPAFAGSCLYVPSVQIELPFVSQV